MSEEAAEEVRYLGGGFGRCAWEAESRWNKSLLAVYQDFQEDERVSIL